MIRNTKVCKNPNSNQIYFLSAKCEVGEGAAVPSLGLSNKAVRIADLQDLHQVQNEGKDDVQAYFRPLSLSG